MAIYRIGIDFGTSFSFAGTQMGGKIEPLIPTDETYGVPSVFYADGKVKLVGRQAERMEDKRPECVVRSVKRNLQQKGSLLTVDGKSYSAEQIVTEIIQYVAESAIKVLTESYRRKFGKGDSLEAVITVPVKFRETELQCIRRAASRVRLNNGSALTVIGMIPEPVAAAIHYFGYDSLANSNILVVDLGGGTLDVAWVNARKGQTPPYVVQDCEGDHHLGGDDWDQVLQQLLVERYRREFRGRLNDRNMARLLKEARELKLDLTNSVTTQYSVEIRDDELEGSVSRALFERNSAPLVQRMIKTVDALMARQGNRKPDHVVLTGGSVNMPMIGEAIRARFPGVDVHLFDPAHAISYGAARYAATLNWTGMGHEVKKSPLIQLIATHGYGISYRYDRLGGDRIRVMIPRGAKLPFTGKVISSTRYENQLTSSFQVFETDEVEDEKALLLESKGREIMSVSLQRTPPVPQGTESEEELTLTQDGLLTVRAFDHKRGLRVENHITIKRD